MQIFWSAIANVDPIRDMLIASMILRNKIRASYRLASVDSDIGPSISNLDRELVAQFSVLEVLAASPRSVLDYLGAYDRTMVPQSTGRQVIVSIVPEYLGGKMWWIWQTATTYVERYNSMHFIYTQRVHTIVSFQPGDMLGDSRTQVLRPATRNEDPTFEITLKTRDQLTENILHCTYEITVHWPWPTDPNHIERRVLHRLFLAPLPLAAKTLQGLGEHLLHVARTIDRINGSIPPWAKELGITIQTDSPVILEDAYGDAAAVLFVAFCSYARFYGQLDQSTSRGPGALYRVMLGNQAPCTSSAILICRNFDALADWHIFNCPLDDVKVYFELCRQIDEQAGPLRVANDLQWINTTHLLQRLRTAQHPLPRKHQTSSKRA